MQKITPFLWFDTQAKEAMDHYVSIFKDSRVNRITYYGDYGHGTPGAVMSVEFELNGVEFYALNAGPMFKFSPATSFYVHCSTQEEIDHYWEKLGEGGKTSQCGWLDDKFGVTWQIIPDILGKYLGDPNKSKANNVMAAMMKMTKMDIAKLQAAYEQV
jgi:predicted 3-demethylubiquinone-9 3-methyltransferase (glyoxalase superfamily)